MDVITTYLQWYDASSHQEFGARVYKISRDSSGNRLTHMKITGSTLKVRDMIGDEKIDQIRVYNGEKFETIKEAVAGTICAVTGLSSTKAGEGLGFEAKSRISELVQPIIFLQKAPCSSGGRAYAEDRTKRASRLIGEADRGSGNGRGSEGDPKAPYKRAL
jgi:translation elongation factor EF-G